MFHLRLVSNHHLNIYDLYIGQVYEHACKVRMQAKHTQFSSKCIYVISMLEGKLATCDH